MLFHRPDKITGIGNMIAKSLIGLAGSATEVPAPTELRKNFPKYLNGGDLLKAPKAIRRAEEEILFAEKTRSNASRSMIRITRAFARM